MIVKEVMKKPYAVDKDISLRDAAQIMSEHNIGSLLFIQKNKIKGILTERDLLKNFGQEENISAIMSKDIIGVDAEEDAMQALELMKEHKVKRLPVLEEGKLIGIVSLTDLAANLEEMEGNFFFE